jgi:hypothetical protein
VAVVAASIRPAGVDGVTDQRSHDFTVGPRLGVAMSARPAGQDERDADSPHPSPAG